MSAAEGYRIIDEPRPAALSRFAFDPFWAVLATMLAGAWLGYGMFIFNAFAIGSAEKRKEVGLAIAGWVGAAAIFAAVVFTAVQLKLGKTELRYLMLLLVLWKMAIAYVLQFSQMKSFELFTHFGGRGRNAALLMIGGYFLRDPIYGVFKGDLLGSLLAMVLM